MACCEKIRTDIVVCDEIFYLNHVEIDVPLGFDVPPGSELSGVVTVTLSSCDVCAVDSILLADLVFLVQKELLLTTPTGEEFPLEFLERLPYVVQFRKCAPCDIDLLGLSFEQLRCYVLYTNGVDTITLNPDNDSFSEDLTIEIKLKITGEVQEFLTLCPRRHNTDITVTSVQ